MNSEFNRLLCTVTRIGIGFKKRSIKMTPSHFLFLTHTHLNPNINIVSYIYMLYRRKVHFFEIHLCHSSDTGKRFITLVGRGYYTCRIVLLHLWEDMITFLEFTSYYTCGETLWHLWLMIRIFQIITLVGLTKLHVCKLYFYVMTNSHSLQRKKVLH